MSMEKFFLALTVLAAVIYVIVKKRRFDLFSISILSAVLFVSPILLSVRLYSSYGTNPQTIPNFVVFYCCYWLLMMIAFAVVNDLLVGKRRANKFSNDFVFSRYAIIAIVLTLAYFVSLIWHYGLTNLYTLSKRQLIDLSGLPLAPYIWLCTLSGIITWHSNLKGRYFITALIYLHILLIGFRVPLVIGSLTIIWIDLHKRGKIQLLSIITFKKILSILLLLILFIGAKPLYSIIKSGDIFDIIALNVDVFLTGAEFLNTQYLFAAVVNKGFKTEWAYLFFAPIKLFPLSEFLYGSSGKFNLAYQTAIYPSIPSGKMGSNPFAEVYSAWQLFGLIVFPLFYNMILFILNEIIASRRHIPISFLTGLIFCFYFYRNGLDTTFGLLRNVIWPYIFIIIISYFVKKSSLIRAKRT